MADRRINTHRMGTPMQITKLGSGIGQSETKISETRTETIKHLQIFLYLFLNVFASL